MSKKENKNAEMPENELPVEEINTEMAEFAIKLEAAEKQIAESKDALLRCMAEYDNFRKRSAKEYASAYDAGSAFAAEALLPVIDTLKLAATAETQDENYKKGVLMTLEKTKEALAKLGITEIEAVGTEFNPDFHNAILQQPAPEGTESGTVLTVVQSGYMMKEKVLRFATVIVAQ